jgi:hypothetical protein
MLFGGAHEFFHGGVVGLADVGSFDDFAEGEEKDFAV